MISKRGFTDSRVFLVSLKMMKTFDAEQILLYRFAIGMTYSI